MSTMCVGRSELLCVTLEEIASTASAEISQLESVFLTCTGRPGRLIGSFVYILSDFWPQNWSEKVRTTLRIHLDQVSGQTVDSGPSSGHFWLWKNLGIAPFILAWRDGSIRGIRSLRCPRGTQNRTCWNWKLIFEAQFPESLFKFDFISNDFWSSTIWAI